jgi:alkylation response protein AidB-like acyl-CoA dehydrogenase
MDLELTEQQSLLRESAGRICGSVGRSTDTRATANDAAGIDKRAFGAIAGAGFLGLLVPDEQGGAGLGAVELSLLLTEAGRHLVVAPLAQQIATARALAKSSNNDLRARWLAHVLTGQTILLPALNGKAAGYVSAGAQPLAHLQGNEIKITGTQPFIVSSIGCDAFMVAASSRGGETYICILERSTPGVSIRSGATIDGSQAEDLLLENVAVPANSVLAAGDPAGALLCEQRDLLNLATSAELLGLSETAHQIACEHIKLRKQFGRPLGSYQVLQHRSVDSFVAIELLRSLVWHVADAIDNDRYHPAMGAALKVKAVRTAFAVTRSTMQMLGAIGYTAEHLIGLLHRRALLLSVLFGSEAGQRAEFARLTGLLEPFEATTEAHQ